MQNLGWRVLLGLSQQGTAAIVGFGVQFALTATLARMVAPEVFGTIILATTYAEFLGLVASASFPQALIQLDDRDGDLVPAVLLLTAALALAMCLLGGLVAVGIRIWQGELFAALFLLIVVGRAAGLFGRCVENRLQRELEIKWVAALRIAGALVTFPVAVGLAHGNHPHLALAMRTLAPGILTGGVAFWYFRRELWQMPRVSREALGRVWGLGGSLLSLRFLELVWFYTDTLIVGWLLGNHTLGLYGQAKYIAMLPAAAVAPISGGIGMRVLVLLKDEPQRLARAYEISQLVVSRFALACAVAVAVEPHLIVGWILGSGWSDSGPYLRALAGWLVVVPIIKNTEVALIALQSWAVIRRALLWQAGAVLVAMPLLVSAVGPIGACYGLTFACSLGGVWLMRGRRLKIPLLVGDTYTRGFLAAAVAVAAGLGFGTLPVWHSQVGGLALALLTYLLTTIAFEGRRLRVLAQDGLAMMRNAR